MPTWDQQPSCCSNETQLGNCAALAAVRSTKRMRVLARQWAIAWSTRVRKAATTVNGIEPPGQRNRCPVMPMPCATLPGAVVAPSARTPSVVCPSTPSLMASIVSAVPSAMSPSKIARSPMTL